MAGTCEHENENSSSINYGAAWSSWWTASSEGELCCLELIWWTASSEGELCCLELIWWTASSEGELCCLELIWWTASSEGELCCLVLIWWTASSEGELCCLELIWWTTSSEGELCCLVLIWWTASSEGELCCLELICLILIKMSTLCFCIIFGYKRILHVFVQKGLVFSIWIAEIVEFVSPGCCNSKPILCVYFKTGIFEISCTRTKHEKTMARYFKYCSLYLLHEYKSNGKERGEEIEDVTLITFKSNNSRCS